MTRTTDIDTRLDRAARESYRAALEGLAPATLARLRPKAAPAPRAHRVPWGWSLAGAGAAALALGFGIGTLMTPPPQTEQAPAPALAQVTTDPPPALEPDAYQDALAAFEEDPDMFLWLASAEAAPMAME